MVEKIFFKLGGMFCDSGNDGAEIGFNILFPRLHLTKEAAIAFNERASAWMEKTPEGEVVIRLYESGEGVETIHWNEYWKYKCFQLKEGAKGASVTEDHGDYEPCAMKFEDIFEEYLGSEYAGATRFEMQFLAYWVEPAFEKL